MVLLDLGPTYWNFTLNKLSWECHTQRWDTSWARITTKLTSLAVLESNSKSSWPSWIWLVTVLGKVIMIPWMVVSFILLEGDHHGDGVRPYPWDSWWPFWTYFLGLLSDQILDGGWPLFGWGMTILSMVDDHPGGGGWPSRGWMETILWKMGDHLREGW